jgi:hypothetical protein
MKTDTLTEYQVTELKEDFANMKQDLKEIKDTVTSIDAKFIGLPCTMHSMRQDAVEKRLDQLEPELEATKSYMNKVAGALLVISLLIQLLGPVLLGVVFPTDKHESKPKPAHSQTATNDVLSAVISIK